MKALASVAPTGLPRRRRTPGWRIHNVPITDGDNHRDAVEAAQTFADRPWAAEARYCGISKNLHVFEYPPPEVKP